METYLNIAEKGLEVPVGLLDDFLSSRRELSKVHGMSNGLGSALANHLQIALIKRFKDRWWFVAFNHMKPYSSVDPAAPTTIIKARVIWEECLGKFWISITLFTDPEPHPSIRLTKDEKKLLVELKKMYEGLKAGLIQHYNPIEKAEKLAGLKNNICVTRKLGWLMSPEKVKDLIEEEYTLAFVDEGPDAEDIYLSSFVEDYEDLPGLR